MGTSLVAPAPNQWDFDKITTVEHARRLQPSTEEARVNRPYIEGDHLQGGDAWIGPRPPEADHRSAQFLTRLAKVFISKNVIEEVCDRLASAVVGRAPRWSWVPKRRVSKQKPVTDAESTAIADLEDALTEWFDYRMVHLLLKRMIYRMLWGKRCAWRLYVPAGLTDDNGVINATTLEDVLRLIYVDVPEPEDAFVVEHPESKRPLGVVFFKNETGTEFAELSYLNQNDETVIRVVPATAVSVSTATNDFDRKITIFQVVVDDPLITEQVRELNRALNMTLTLLGKGLIDTHFLERMFIDIMPPGEWETDEAGNRTVFKPDLQGRTTGDRVDTFLQSSDVEDKDGKVQLAKGQVITRDPSDPTGTIKGSEYWYQALLEEVRQDHILINQSATPSGKSRDEARTDFADSGKDPELQLEIAGRMLLWTVVAMAEAFLKQPGKWTSLYKPVFSANARYGRISVEERQQNREDVKENLIAVATAQALAGIDDTEAESSAIAMQKDAQLRRVAEMAKIVQALTADFPRTVALRIVGFDDKEIDQIVTWIKEADAEDPAPDLPAPGADPTAKPGVPGRKPALVKPPAKPTNRVKPIKTAKA
jgi:hypothetical protein